MNHQQLLVMIPNQKDFQPSDDYLFELANQMLNAQKPSALRLGLNIGRDVAIPFSGSLSKLMQKDLPQHPEDRALLLISVKPLVVELLRKVYTNNVSGLMPEVSVVSASDSVLQKYQCIDGYFSANIVYARHPADPNFFIRVANFHSYLLQEKRAEFFRLAASLGAKTIRQSDLKKVESQGSVRAGVVEPTKAVNMNAESSFRNERDSRFDLAANFAEATSNPRMPENMKWINHEPLWQAMAEARLENWVDHFTLSFTYSQDFNITTDLVGKISEFGLSAGGNFSKIEVIDQEYTVEFFPRSAYGG
jgi:hypothetical protein